MKSILKKIIPSLWLAASFAFPAAVLAQSLTSSQIQQVNSGLFRSNSQDFFQQGNRQMEQRITSSWQKHLTVEELILEMDEKFHSELCHKEFQISSRNFETINAAKMTSIQTKVTDFCRHN